uniref:inorganic diphosphatase n=1 Tax=Trepomonas sp. PC1 TaxID=1076344 RepID=A0A146KF27_9EUKA|eukprot:JAP95087.1 Inorganic diphosphatase [Trepomonas sp. PC1]
MPKGSITYVCGHKNPDTDSVCSAICYARLLTKVHQNKTYIPIAAGPLSDQTKFVLQECQQEQPQVITDISPQAKDLPDSGRVTLHKDDPLSTALLLHNKEQQMDYAVLDDDNTCMGVLQINDLISSFMRPNDESDLTFTWCTIQSLKKTLGAYIWLCPRDDKKLENFKIVVPTMDLDGFKIVSKDWTEERWRNSLFIIGYNPSVANYIVEQKAGVIVFTKSTKTVLNAQTGTVARKKSSENLTVLGDVQTEHINPLMSLLTSQENQTVIMTTELSVTASTILVKQAMPVHLLIKQDKLFMVKHTTKLRDIKERFAIHRQIHALAVVDSNNKFLNLLKRYDTDDLNLVNLILTDHNEIGQQINGSKSIGVNVVEIVDHHKMVIDEHQKIAKLTIKPVGCTCTIIYQQYIQKKQPIDKQTAKLLLSAIMTDTMTLNSVTTTEIDRQTVQKLELLAGISYQDLGQKIFSSAKGFAGDFMQVIRGDYKLFDAKQGKYGASQVEVGGFQTLTEEVLEQIKQTLVKIKEMDSLFLVCCLVTDVQTNSSILMINGPAGLQGVMGYQKWQNYDWCYNCPGVMSRKKQLIPHLSNALNALE